MYNISFRCVFIIAFLKSISCPLLVKQTKMPESGQLANDTHLCSGDIKKEAYGISVRLRVWNLSAAQLWPAFLLLEQTSIHQRQYLDLVFF